ncbi:MAG: type II toxin-antitoxin system HicA family toxin [Candidatus Hodarchaeota archaeon]
MSDQKMVPIHYSLLIKVFELYGFSIRRRKGDDIIMTKLGVKGLLVIKTSPKLVPVTHLSEKRN